MTEIIRAPRAADFLAALPSIVGYTATNRVVPVICTDATFADERGIPWLDFSRELAKRLRDAGYRTPDELCVAADGWASYFERDYPRDGHPLEEIATSEVGALALEARGSDARDISEHSTLPEPDLAYVREAIPL